MTLKKYLLHTNTHITAAVSLLIYLSVNNINALKEYFGRFNGTFVGEFFFFSFLCSSIILSSRKSISKKYPETKSALNIISVVMFVSAVISYYLYTLSSESPGKDYQSSITLLISTVLIGSGWWVQAVISKVASRKAHTINTLMAQRNSELFYNNNKSISDNFGFRKTINENLARKITDPDHADVKGKEIKGKYKAPAKNVLFILNYYEFICSGINKNDFDKDLAFDCLSQIITSIEIRYFYYLKIVREKEGKESFENIIKTIEEWSPSGSIVLRSENGGQVGNIVTVFSDDSAFFKNP